MAIQLELACSEATARRALKDAGGVLERVIENSMYIASLKSWDDLSEFNRGFVYGVLSARTTRMLDDGWGRRL
jgi:hypothetical protein